MTLLYRGCGAVLVEAFKLDEAVELFARKGVTMAGGGTAFYQMYLAKQRTQPGTPIIPSLRLLSGGGAPKPPEMYTEVKEEMGIPVCRGYGMTECPMIAQGGPDDTEAQLMYTDGAPVTGIAIRIVTLDGDESRRRATTARSGCKGPMVFKGYIDPSLDAEAFDDDGWFRTGDLGHLDADGYVMLTGRLEGRHHPQGREHLGQGDRGPPLQAPQGRRRRRDRPARPRAAASGCARWWRPPRAPSRSTFAEMVAFLQGHELMVQKIPEQLEIVDVLPRTTPGQGPQDRAPRPVPRQALEPRPRS